MNDERPIELTAEEIERVKTDVRICELEGVTMMKYPLAFVKQIPATIDNLRRQLTEAQAERDTTLAHIEEQHQVHVRWLRDASTSLATAQQHNRMLTEALTALYEAVRNLGEDIPADIDGSLLDRAQDALAGDTIADVPALCVWSQDDNPESDVWVTDCGQTYLFIEGGPTTNGVRFCHFCGKPVREEAWSAEDNEIQDSSHIEEYIRSLTYSPGERYTTDEVMTIVAGNIRAFYNWLTTRQNPERNHFRISS